MRYGVIVAVIVLFGFTYCEADQIVQNEEKKAVTLNETKAQPDGLENVKSDTEHDLEGKKVRFNK